MIVARRSLPCSEVGLYLLPQQPRMLPLPPLSLAVLCLLLLATGPEQAQGLYVLESTFRYKLSMLRYRLDDAQQLKSVRRAADRDGLHGQTGQNGGPVLQPLLPSPAAVCAVNGPPSRDLPQR